jgi:glycine/sarcosine N-methyltransferase
MDFFDNISEFYDSMIDFKLTLNRRKELLKNLVKNNAKTAVDLGCGSGLDSISLAMLGLNVTGFDLSKKMINIAQKNSQKLGLKISFLNSGIEYINETFNNKFDLAVSLGNTLPNLNKPQLKKALVKIYNILAPKGNLLIQMVNFEQIISNGERILNITKKDNFNFVRFYDFFPTYFNFNILIYNQDNLKKKNLYTTKLYPHRKSDIVHLLMHYKFKNIKCFGSLRLEKYHKYYSKDLIIIANK